MESSPSMVYPKGAGDEQKCLQNGTFPALLSLSTPQRCPSSTSSTSLNSSLSQSQTTEFDLSSLRKEKDTEASNPESGSAPDPILITWDGDGDPLNPKNWSIRRKWVVTLIVSGFAFVAPLSSSMIAPSLDGVDYDLHISNDTESFLVLSIFVLGYSFAPFVLSPCSEVWGRTRVIQLANLAYIVFNLACGFARTSCQLIVFRFLSGLGGSATLGIGGGVLSDCWRPDERGRGAGVYSLAPVLGPAIGPIAGGFIAKHTTWRWSFWSITVFNVVVQAAGLLLLQETYAPRILYLKAKELRRQTGNENLRTEWETKHPGLPRLLRTSLTRPWRMLGTQPVIQVLALYQAFTYGLLYLLIASFPRLWEERYGESPEIGALNYISLALGLLMGAQICAPLNDAILKRLKTHYGYKGDDCKPEFRIPLMAPASVLVPVGILLYGWSAQYRLFWLVPDIGVCLYAFGSIVSYQSTQLYVIDSYQQYAASATAASTCLRSFAAFSFPLFAPYLYDSFGYGRGTNLMAIIAVILGVPAPILLWKYGEALRARSPFAVDG